LNSDHAVGKAASVETLFRKRDYNHAMAKIPGDHMLFSNGLNDDGTPDFQKVLVQ